MRMPESESQVQVGPPSVPATPRTPWTVAAFHRYRDGYAVAGFVNGVGWFVIVIGLCVLTFAGLIILAAMAGLSSKDSAAAIVSALGVPLAIAMAIWGGIFAVVGLAIRCLAQLTLATLDTAMHTSPFLDNEDRAAAMGLRAGQ